MISTIISKIKDSVPALRLVENVAGFQRASEGQPAATPAAYVFLVKESGDDESLDAPMIQRVVAMIATVLVVRNVGDAGGGAANTSMDSVRESVRAAILGMTIDDGYDPLAFVDSAPVAFRDGCLWWQMTWRTSYYLSAE